MCDIFLMRVLTDDLGDDIVLRVRCECVLRRSVYHMGLSGICVCVCVSIYVRERVCVYIYVYVCVCVCMYACMYVCMCVCVCVYTIYTHIHVFPMKERSVPLVFKHMNV